MHQHYSRHPNSSFLHHGLVCWKYKSHNKCQNKCQRQHKRSPRFRSDTYFRRNLRCCKRPKWVLQHPVQVYNVHTSLNNYIVFKRFIYAILYLNAEPPYVVPTWSFFLQFLNTIWQLHSEPTRMALRMVLRPVTSVISDLLFENSHSIGNVLLTLSSCWIPSTIRILSTCIAVLIASTLSHSKLLYFLVCSQVNAISLLKASWNVSIFTSIR